MMASSAAWSTSETKSFWRLLRTVSFSRSKEARLMMLPALRAALTAVLSIGCMEGAWGSRRPQGVRGAMRRFYSGFRHNRLHGRTYPSRARRGRAVAAEPSGQHRRRGARDEDHGLVGPARRRAEAISRSRGR